MTASGIGKSYTLANEEAVKRSSNSRSPARPQLEKAVAKRSRIWQLQVWTVLH
jgi:hypothetical protein